MTPKEILEKAFESDLEVLKKAFESDEEILEMINKEINKQLTAIWTCLIDKGLIKMEDFKKYKKITEETTKVEKVGE